MRGGERREEERRTREETRGARSEERGERREERREKREERREKREERREKKGERIERGEMQQPGGVSTLRVGWTRAAGRHRPGAGARTLCRPHSYNLY